MPGRTAAGRLAAGVTPGILILFNLGLYGPGGEGPLRWRGLNPHATSSCQIDLSQSRLHVRAPGEPARREGYYEALNVFGTKIGRIIQVKEGEALPDLPRGFSWRRITQARE